MRRCESLVLAFEIAGAFRGFGGVFGGTAVSFYTIGF